MYNTVIKHDGHLRTREKCRKQEPQAQKTIKHAFSMFYTLLYNNKINARVLIGQSAMVYCAGKPMEKSRVF